MPMDQAKLNKRIDDVVRMRSILHPKDWQDESQLMMTRWFDYRFMSPLDATLLFGRHYIAGLRSHMRKHFDAERAGEVAGIKEGLPAARATWFTGLWRARARTDAIFVPYDLLINFSFDFSANRKRFWNMLPQQLHASQKNAEAWWALFHERVEDELPVRMKRVGETPHYRIENDLDLPPQRHFRNLMLSEMRHENRMLAEQIADRVLVKRHLTLDQGLSLVAPNADRNEVEQRAKAIAEDRAWEVQSIQKLDEADLLPSCFAIAEAIDESREPCGNCVLASSCKQAAGEAIEITIRRKGSASPVLTESRERIRRNTKTCRSNKKLKSPAVSQ